MSINQVGVRSLAEQRPELLHKLLAHISARRSQLAVLLLVCLTAALAFYNLNIYPWPDFDEGAHLLAARTLAFEGRYTFGPAIGPTILVPVAISLRIFGANLLAARLVMSAYLILSVIVFSALARQLSNWRASWAATLLYLLSPSTMVIWFGRAVLGEVPATMFALSGMLVWFKAVDEAQARPRRQMLVLSGLLVSLAILSKNQFLLLLPAWLVVWLLDRRYYHQAGHLDFALPIVCAFLCPVAWYAGEWFLFPDGRALALGSQTAWATAAGRGILTFSPTRMFEALKFLTGQDAYYGWVFPACLYAGLRSLRPSREALRWALLLIVVAGWLAWFVLLSVAWPRYAFLPLTISAVFVANLFHDTTGGFRVPLNRLASIRSGEWDAALMGKVLLLALFVILAARGFEGRLYDLTARRDTYPQQMAAYIGAHLPPTAMIETFDPEVCFLSGRVCHFPLELMEGGLKHVFYGGPPPSTSYRFEEQSLPYLLIGGSSKFYHIYDRQVISHYYQLEVTIGHYDLYHLQPGS